jgi:putative glutamine amidotransferase
MLAAQRKQLEVRRSLVMLLTSAASVPHAIAGAYLADRHGAPPQAPRIGLSVAAALTLQRLACELAVIRAGGRPVLLAPTDTRPRVATLLDRVSGLLLSGGDDLDPRLYGGDPDSANRSDRRRDEFELQLLEAAAVRDMPVLGICRGSQLLNVACGGSVRNLRGDEALAARHGPGLRSFGGHDVQVRSASKLAAGLAAGVHRVNSFHGQAVARLGAELRVSATAQDGVIEGTEHTRRSFFVGVQWHPEIAALLEPAALGLFEELVRRADAYRGRHFLMRPTSHRTMPAAT